MSRQTSANTRARCCEPGCGRRASWIVGAKLYCSWCRYTKHEDEDGVQLRPGPSETKHARARRVRKE